MGETGISKSDCKYLLGGPLKLQILVAKQLVIKWGLSVAHSFETEEATNSWQRPIVKVEATGICPALIDCLRLQWEGLIPSRYSIGFGCRRNWDLFPQKHLSRPVWVDASCLSLPYILQSTIHALHGLLDYMVVEHGVSIFFFRLIIFLSLKRKPLGECMNRSLAKGFWNYATGNWKLCQGPPTDLGLDL